MRFSRAEVTRRPVRSRGLARLSAAELKPLRSPAKRALNYQRRSARILLWSGVVSRCQLRDLGSSPGLAAVPLSSRSRLEPEPSPTRPSPQGRVAAGLTRPLPEGRVGAPGGGGDQDDWSTVKEAVRHAHVTIVEVAETELGNVDSVRDSDKSKVTGPRDTSDVRTLDRVVPRGGGEASSLRKVAPPKPPRPSKSATNLHASTNNNRKSGPSTKSAPSLLAAAAVQPSDASSGSAPLTSEQNQHQHPAHSTIESSATGLSQISPKMPEQTDSSAASGEQQQLRESQRALKRTRQHLELQEARSRQLVTACAAKLRDQQAQSERLVALKDRQFQRILQQLAVLQSKLKREQKLIYHDMSERDQLSQQQARELERLRRANRRLLGKVTRLSAPCAHCGTKPDSGISDCDEPAELAPKQAKTGGSPDSAMASAESSDAASPPTAERGIMKTTREQRKAPPKTVTFSLSGEPRERERATRRPPLPLKPRLILPPSAHVNGTTFGQPSIVTTISQLLGVEVEGGAGQQPDSAPPAPLTVIPEDLESSREAPPAVQQAEDKENVPQETTKSIGEETPAQDQSNQKPKNAPRSRSNINLIMSEREGVKIKDNFEEFKFEEDMAGSVCSDTASERSADNGREEKLSFDRRAGDGAETEPAETQPTVANYDKFLEHSGLSQKSIRTPKRMFTNHRSMLKPSDVKHRHRSKLLDGFTIEDVSPTSVRYYSEEL